MFHVKHTGFVAGTRRNLRVFGRGKGARAFFGRSKGEREPIVAETRKKYVFCSGSKGKGSTCFAAGARKMCALAVETGVWGARKRKNGAVSSVLFVF